MKTALGWTIAGAVVPVGLLLITFVPVAIAMGAETFVSNLGMLTLSIVLLAVPGAVIGALVGLLDRSLAHYISREPGAPRLYRATAVMLLVLVAGTLVLLAFTASSGLSVLQYALIGLGLAAIPTLVAHRRYRVLASGLRRG
jgi:hypothetical protein